MHCSQKQSISVETPRDDKTIILLGAAFYSSVSSSINLDRLSPSSMVAVHSQVVTSGLDSV